jgi:site-specific recombinase XerD
VKLLKLPASSVTGSPIFRHEDGQPPDLDVQLFKARVLAYATSTWLSHANAIQVFIQFCESRELDVFECTPYILNLCLFYMAQQGKSFGSIQRCLSAISFVFRFFHVTDIVQDPSVYELKRFLAKACPHIANKKQPFGSAEVRALWNKIAAQPGGFTALSQAELRTFVMIVIQHASFCRFSDLQNVTLNDLLFELDYFKIHIRYSKTDQNGIGQSAFVPKIRDSEHDPHKLMCLYLQLFPQGENDPPQMYLFPPLS